MSHPAVYKSPQQRLSIRSCQIVFVTLNATVMKSPNCTSAAEVKEIIHDTITKPLDSDKLLSKPTQTGEGCQLQQQTNTENGPRHVLPAAILNHRCKIGISESILSAVRLKMTLKRQFFRGCANKSFALLLLGGKNLWCSELLVGIWKRQSGKQTHVYPVIAHCLEGLSLLLGWLRASPPKCRKHFIISPRHRAHLTWIVHATWPPPLYTSISNMQMRQGYLSTLRCHWEKTPPCNRLTQHTTSLEVTWALVCQTPWYHVQVTLRTPGKWRGEERRVEVWGWRRH